MKYKIRITSENQAIVKRIADENDMNTYGFKFFNLNHYYHLENNKFTYYPEKDENYTELTTEQFIELFDKKETEVEKWLKETKAKNLSFNDFGEYVDHANYHIITQKLKGNNPKEKAEILFNQWNNPTQESPIVETELQPKRGDRVLVWDDSEKNAATATFLVKIEGAELPIRVVAPNEEYKFIQGREFPTSAYKHMKPLPIEKPKETDFKSKVIELIEKNINDKKEKLKFVIDKNNLIYEAVLESIVAIQKDLLNQIKQL